MKRIVILIVSVLCVISAHGQIQNVIAFDSTEYYTKLFADNSEFDIREFRPLPSYGKVYDFNRWLLIDAIKPTPGYVYWECRYCPPGEVGRIGQLMVYHGDRETYGYWALRKPVNNIGFFVECSPNICYSYIVTANEDKSTYVVDNEKKLIEFMGEVDNIEEVLLHIKANNYWYDENALIGGAYKEECDYYLLYLMESSDFPVTFKSVKAILYKTGEFEIISKTTYKKSNSYIVS